ncbi:hypothetical protein LOZ66_003876 [Ophidiomyces ophidiicola]|nr:hypothetical protein LOZ65_003576 [Ophidiomyces ophidiicola]KAI1937596.1 hypothetical protein LOZ66_003876 [Ophidiomyces ophidiicola]
MLTISVKSQHPHIHNTDSSTPESSSLSSSNPPVAQAVKQSQSSAIPNTMLVVTAPTIPSPPIIHSNPNSTNKRPKLSLQTSCLPVSFGNSTTGLSLNRSAGCSPSPTVRNTFKNAFDAYQRTSSPASRTRSDTPMRDYKASKLDCAPMSQSRHSYDGLPYQVPLGIRGILRNSPIPVCSLRRASLSASASNGPGNGRRILFPAKKRVAYRFPIDEEIKTVRFTDRHSDLTSDSSATLSSSSEGESGSDISDLSSASDEEPIFCKETETRGKRKKHSRYTRQVRAAGLRDIAPRPNEEPITPQTPIARRSKRQRQWRWTLGPIKDGHVQMTCHGSRLDAAPEPIEPRLLQEEGRPTSATLLSSTHPSIPLKLDVKPVL